MNKAKMHTPNITEENIAKIASIFPHCVTESEDENGKIKQVIDFDLLKQELSDRIIDGPQERYQLNWPGKREALLTANAPIAKTLRPCREESVNFDSTENLFIEGDNLDSLKLIQETYLGKVKLIYIDPPYNTGNDFIYDDDFSESIEDFLKKSNQKDDDGNRLRTNTESNGRFHTDWLNTMYPRLKLARNLLRDDGVIFISIDDIEAANMRKICDEIFGAKNFIADIIWQKKFSRANDAAYFSTMHDHIFCYAKNSRVSNEGKAWELKLLSRGNDLPSGYANPDNDNRGYWTSVVLSAKSGTEKLKYEIITPSGRKCFPPDGRYWSVNKTRFQELVNDNRIWFGKKGDAIPRIKTFLSEVQDGLRPNSIWFHEEVGHNQEGKQEVKKLFNDKAFFDSPKPIKLLKQIIQVSNSQSNDIILDFFAGSSTTAHAVMEQNATDGETRKFIMIQIPESNYKEVNGKTCPKKGTAGDAFKAGYKTIAEISKERIRRAGVKIKEENADKEGIENLDVGFRVLKVDTSNLKDVYYNPDKYEQNLLTDLEDNIKEDRTSEDLLFQVLLDWGVDLTLPVAHEEIAGNEVFFVDDNTLVACFESDGKVTEDFVKELAQRSPLRVVFRDAGFASDDVKINVEQIFKLMSPHTEVKCI